MTKQNKSMMSFRLPNSLKTEIETRAKQEEASTSEVVRYALSNFVKDEA